jgi:hypothetical protein
VNHFQRSIIISLNNGENPNRKLWAETEHLSPGYIVRVNVNGVRPLNANCLRSDLNYEFITTTGNTNAADEWYALAGGDEWLPQTVN